MEGRRKGGREGEGEREREEVRKRWERSREEGVIWSPRWLKWHKLAWIKR